MLVNRPLGSHQRRWDCLTRGRLTALRTVLRKSRQSLTSRRRPIWGFPIGWADMAVWKSHERR